MKFRSIFLVLLWSLSSPVFSEDAKVSDKEATPTPSESSTSPAPEEQPRKKITREDIIRRFSKPENEFPKVGILEPLDFTTLGVTEATNKKVEEFFKQFSEDSVRTVNEKLDSLTLEEFRRVMVKHRLTVAVVTILKPTNIDVFIFDKRNPYGIYLNSEIFPEELQYKVTPKDLEGFLDKSLKRALINYYDHRDFQLPRIETETFLSAEIPKWIASPLTFRLANKEFISDFYGSVSMGAALSIGDSRVWNSNCYNVSLGIRATDKLFVEGSIDLFAYGVSSVGLKYLWVNKSNSFLLLGGVGVGLGSSAHTLNWDQYYTQEPSSIYLIPSTTMLVPLGDVHVKLETRLFYAMASSTMVFSVLPGIFVLF